jgi:hypothetical protein
MHLLTEQDVLAINRLLEWRAEAVLAGYRARVELAQSGDDQFCALLWDNEDRLQLAYEPTIAAAIDRVLEAAGPAPERDTHPCGLPAPTEPPPAAAETPLEQLIA